jgi:hypothetical protein
VRLPALFRIVFLIFAFIVAECINQYWNWQSKGA